MGKKKKGKKKGGKKKKGKVKKVKKIMQASPEDEDIFRSHFDTGPGMMTEVMDLVRARKTKTQPFKEKVDYCVDQFEKNKFEFEPKEKRPIPVGFERGARNRVRDLYIDDIDINSVKEKTIITEKKCKRMVKLLVFYQPDSLQYHL